MWGTRLNFQKEECLYLLITKFSRWVENSKRPSVSLTFKTNYWYGYSWHNFIFLICFWPLSKRMLLIWILINCIGDVLKLLALRDHPLKTSAFLRGEGSKMCQICRRIVVKKGHQREVGVKNRENLPMVPYWEGNCQGLGAKHCKYK